MKETVQTWKRKKSKEIADCRVFKVREDFCARESDGEESSFFVIENPDWVNIIAFTKTQEVVLIEQFRYGAEKIILELPGGMIDEDEEPTAAAKRELAEETGYASDEFILLGQSHPNPAIQNNAIYHFLAVNCEKTAETSFDEHESVATKLVSLPEVENLIVSGDMTHSLAIAAFHYYSLHGRNE